MFDVEFFFTDGDLFYFSLQYYRTGDSTSCGFEYGDSNGGGDMHEDQPVLSGSCEVGWWCNRYLPHWRGPGDGVSWHWEFNTNV